MQVLYPKNELSNQKLCSFLFKKTVLVQHLRKIPILTVLNAHVQMLRSLESVDQVQEIRVIQSLHDVGFRDSVFYLVIADQVLLLHYFESDDLPGILLLALEHTAEGSLADQL